MFMLPLFTFLRSIAKPISFLPRFFPPLQISLFWKTSVVITPSRTQKVPLIPMERKHSIGSSPLTFSHSMTLTYLHFFIAPLAVAPPLISLFSLTLSCSWKVLQNLGCDHLPILLTVPFSPTFRPNERLTFFEF